MYYARLARTTTSSLILAAALVAWSRPVAAADPPAARSMRMSELLDAAGIRFAREKSEADRTVRTAIGEVFSGKTCPLPKRLNRKLKRASSNQKEGTELDPYIPADLRADIGDDNLARNVRSIRNESVSSVLHFIEATKADGQVVRLSLTGAPTYSQLDPSALIDPERSNTAYSYDCSGYLNAAISMSAAVPAFQIRGAASTSLSTQRSMVVALAVLASPVAMAIQPDAFTMELAPSERLGVLHAILSEANALKLPDTTALTVWRQVELLWTTKSGSSSFQGKAELNAGGGGNAGVFSISGSGNAGGAFSRKISFAQFNTHVLNDAVTPPITRSLGELRTTAMGLATHAAILRPARKVDRVYDFTIDLPKHVCEGPWTLRALTCGPEAEPSCKGVAGTASGAWSADGCHFTASPTSGESVIDGQKGLRLVSPGAAGPKADYEFALVVP